MISSASYPLIFFAPSFHVFISPLGSIIYIAYSFTLFTKMRNSLFLSKSIVGIGVLKFVCVSIGRFYVRNTKVRYNARLKGKDALTDLHMPEADGLPLLDGIEKWTRR